MPWLEGPAGVTTAGPTMFAIPTGLGNGRMGTRRTTIPPRARKPANATIHADGSASVRDVAQTTPSTQPADRERPSTRASPSTGAATTDSLTTPGDGPVMGSAKSWRRRTHGAGLELADGGGAPLLWTRTLRR